MKVASTTRRRALVHLLMLGVSSVALASLSTGCAKGTEPGPLHRVQPMSDLPRAGNAYLVRGFIGVFSRGVDDLCQQLNETGIRAYVFQSDQRSALARRIRDRYRDSADSEPLVLIGHSYGADDVIRIARELEKDRIAVDLLVTLDPVTPPRVPANVRHALNIYQSNGAWDRLPFLRGVAVRADDRFTGRLENFDIKKDRQDLLEPRTDHFNIEKKGKVHEEVLGYVLMTCPPRHTWLASRERLSPQGTQPERGDGALPAGHRLGN